MVTRSLKPSLLPTLPFGRNTPEEGLPGPDELHLVSQNHISRPKTPFSPPALPGAEWAKKPVATLLPRGGPPSVSFSMTIDRRPGGAKMEARCSNRNAGGTLRWPLVEDAVA